MSSATQTQNNRRPRSMFGGLLILNVALLAVLAGVTFGPSADAQSRQAGEYLIVGGGLKGTNADAIYVVDTINEEVIAVRYDHTEKQLAGLGYRHLGRDAAELTQSGRHR